MSKPLKIAMIGHKRIPSREGGIEIVVEELSTRMAVRGYEVTCYNRRGHHVSGKEFDQDIAESYKGVKIRTVPAVEKKGLSAVTSSFFAAMHSAIDQYDVVHFHAEGPSAMIWIPKLFHKRCVVTVHGLDWARDKWKHGFGARYIKFGEREAVKKADEMIVLSKGIQKYFKDTYGRDTVYIPNGVNRPELVEANEITEKLGLHKDEYFLFLGRIVPEKGIRYLMEAFKKAATEKKLVIAGGASDTDKFAAEVKALAADDDRIRFTGFVQGRILKELYSNAYVYILPSDLEGMPLSLLEAMSYGNCCLVSDIPECTEVVEDQAVVFQKSDINDLAQKISDLSGDPVRVRSYKEKASDFICSKYNWDDVVEKTLAIYHGDTLNEDSGEKIEETEYAVGTAEDSLIKIE